MTGRQDRTHLVTWHELLLTSRRRLMRTKNICRAKRKVGFTTTYTRNTSVWTSIRATYRHTYTQTTIIDSGHHHQKGQQKIVRHRRQRCILQTHACASQSVCVPFHKTDQACLIESTRLRVNRGRPCWDYAINGWQPTCHHIIISITLFLISLNQFLICLNPFLISVIEVLMSMNF